MKNLAKIAVLVAAIVACSGTVSAAPAQINTIAGASQSSSSFNAMAFFKTGIDTTISFKSLSTIKSLLTSNGFKYTSAGTTTLKEWNYDLDDYKKRTAKTLVYKKAGVGTVTIALSSNGSSASQIKVQFTSSSQRDNFTKKAKSDMRVMEPGSYIMNGYLDSEATMQIQGNTVILEYN